MSKATAVIGTDAVRRWDHSSMGEVDAGWYPDPHDPDRLRYWDGVQWTHARTPVGATPPTLPDLARAPSPARRPRLPSNLLVGIVVGLAVLVLVVGLVVVSGLARPPAATTAGPTGPPTSVPTPGPAGDADAAAFRDDAAKQLDDMAKDLDDIVTTVAEHGVFRLYSNSVELEFNLAQLRAIAIPASVATTWPAALDAIGASLGALDDAIGTGDDDTILRAVDGVRAQVDAARDVARAAS